MISHNKNLAVSAKMIVAIATWGRKAAPSEPRFAEC
jgi:hypothetical protein